MHASTPAGPASRRPAGSKPFQATARSLFRVEPGERASVAIMMAYSAAAVGGVLTIGYGGVSQALFFSRLPASDVPFTLILPAASIVLTLLLYNRLGSRFRLPPLAVGSSALLMLAGLILWGLLIAGHGKSFGVVAAIFLYCETAASVMILQFWTFAGQIFNPRQARRLFGLIAAGGTASSVLAGLTLVLLARFVGVDNLLLVVAGSIGVCGACAVALRKQIPVVAGTRPGPRRQGVAAAPASVRSLQAKDRSRDSPRRPACAAPKPGPQLLRDIRAIWRSPLLRAIAGLSFLVSLLVNIGAYQFFLALQIHYTGRGPALAEFLGVFAAWTGLAALVIQLFITGPAMIRFGFLAVQMCFPLAMVATGGASLIAWGPLWAITLTRACDPILRRTTHEASVNALYLPVPAELRARARTVMEIVYAVTFGLAGAVFLLVQHTAPGWTYQYWSIPALFLAACWLALLLWARPQYVRALDESVNRRRLDLAGLAIDVTEDTTAQLLIRTLNSGDDRQVVYVLQLLMESSDPRWRPHIEGLLTHPSPQVRVATLHYLGREADPSLHRQIAALLDAPEDEVRAAAIEAMFALDSTHAIPVAVSQLDHPGPRTVCAAVTGLITRGNTEYVLLAARRLKAMLTSGQPAMRRAGADVLGALAGRPLDVSALSIIVGSGHKAPVSTAGAPREPGETPAELLIGLLGDRATRASAADALARRGQDSVPALGALLDDPTRDSALRIQACRILDRIGRASAVQILLRHLTEPDERVRAAVYQSLARLQSTGTDVSVDKAALDGRIMVELRRCYELKVWHADIREQDKDGLLGDAINERIERAIDRIFFLLAIRYPEHDLARARQLLIRTAGQRAQPSGYHPARAMAIELLDNLLDRELGDRPAGVKLLLLPLLEAPIDRLVEIARTRLDTQPKLPSDRLQQLAGNDDPWLRACAIHRIGTLEDPRLVAVVTAALSADNPLVRETAVVARDRLVASAQVLAHESKQSDATEPLSVRRHPRSHQSAGQPVSSCGDGDAADD